MELTAEYILAELERHADVLRGLGVRRIGLFGSVARGESGPDSDLDFLVELREHKYRLYKDTLHFLEDHFGVDIDLVEFAALRDEYRPGVLAEVIYAEGL